MKKRKNVVDYKLVRGTAFIVEPEIQKLVSTGWQLRGKIFLMKYDGYDILVQPMVKYEN